MQIPIGNGGSLTGIDSSSSPLDRVTSSGDRMPADGDGTKVSAETTTLSRVANIEALMTAIDAVGGIRQDLVDHYRQSVQTGGYQIDASAVADALIADVGE